MNTVGKIGIIISPLEDEKMSPLSVQPTDVAARGRPSNQKKQDENGAVRQTDGGGGMDGNPGASVARAEGFHKTMGKKPSQGGE